MKKQEVILLSILGLLFLALGFYYWLTQAGSLQHFVPGYEAGSLQKHFKHGLASVILGIGCFVWAWFKSGVKTSAGSGKDN